MKNILLCTLGASWAVVPEVCAFIDPGRFPLFRNHPDLIGMKRQAEAAGAAPIDELFICTTEGQRASESICSLLAWWRQADEGTALRIWRAGGTEQLVDRDECLRMRELIFRAVLHANDWRGSGRLWLSVAGGRKTMSADLQRAGQVLGCDALLHVVDDGGLTETLKTADPALFSGALATNEARHLTPLLVGRGIRSELLDVDLDGEGAVSPSRFPLPMPRSGEPVSWETSGAGPSLADEIDERESQGGRLLGNYLKSLASNEHHENWRMLYRLPPKTIDRLRNTPLDPSHLTLLRALPKADLHRHIGGTLSLAAQRRVGHAVWQAMSGSEQGWALGVVGPLLASEEWPGDWPAGLKEHWNGDRRRRAFLSAALLERAAPEQLMFNLYAVTEPRVGLADGAGFWAYERPGELTGSAILGAPKSIQVYAQELVRQAVAEGLVYVELRGSPTKYDDDGIRFLRRMIAGLERAMAQVDEPARPLVRLILIADRRQPNQIPAVVSLAVKARQRFGDWVVGLDLAGDEKEGDPEMLAGYFSPAFESCIPVTIHAGEGDQPENVWKAAYHLHADRIGHGLTLGQNQPLLERFRDRGICIEMCPTSNLEVVGFHDPEMAEGQPRTYPLGRFLKEGITVTLCTDNPGISRTGMAEEYLAAARMTDGGLTLWQALSLMKQGFAHSFLPAPEKERLMKKIDARVYQVIGTWGGSL